LHAQGTDPVEVKRIQDAGGLVVLNRVSGILAVTRSLGDLKLKASTFVVLLFCFLCYFFDRTT
jgi:hypothetical protein